MRFDAGGRRRGNTTPEFLLETSFFIFPFFLVYTFSATKRRTTLKLVGLILVYLTIFICVFSVKTEKISSFFPWLPQPLHRAYWLDLNQSFLLLITFCSKFCWQMAFRGRGRGRGGYGRGGVGGFGIAKQEPFVLFPVSNFTHF